ncbi:jg22855 [Pararge aegeria aegeria]|uniref:Jg22855 protein n=1 Tax=Pararge aegeria aegeria TaxID=348720 RepID=A0A8S4R220_9NEOP|nr:jg22855 [Pararge aegeria aegeria]
MILTAQRLSDQVRAIQRRHLLDKAQLERLRLALPQIDAISKRSYMSDGVDLEDTIVMYRYKPLNLRLKQPHVPNNTLTNMA